MLKRVAILLFCLLMIFVATFGFVVGVVSVPTIYSYAAVDDDPIYVPLRDPSDAVTAFQAYCKSRDLTIEGSLTDAVTTFTTGAFNSACNEIGINISELQAEIKAEYDQAGKPIKFFFNDTGVMAMNRIFAQFLQDNELEVGDTDVNKNVYSGKLYIDADNNYCLVYVQPSTTTSSSDKSLVCSAEGTPYVFNTDNWTVDQSNLSGIFNLTESQYATYYFTNYRSGSYRYIGLSVAGSSREDIISWKYTDNVPVRGRNGNAAIIYRESTNKLYIGYYYYNLNGSYYTLYPHTEIINTSGASNTNINIVAVQINNNNYEGDTIINNEGDVIVEPDPVPPGGTDPGWDIGGGGGTATDGNGNTWNIQFPDFQLPDLNIDWSINGLGEKFPFSIPFDLVALVTVLNAEPQAPRFEGTVNFGFTTWDYDINLQQFDSVAQACRIAELLLLVVGLILITRSIIKG